MRDDLAFQFRRWAIGRSHRALGVITSLAFHVSAAAAAMLLGAPSHAVRLEWQRPAGSSASVQLLATMAGPQQPIEQTQAPVESSVLVTPERAEIAQRMFVQSSTAVDRLPPEVPKRPRPAVSEAARAPTEEAQRAPAPQEQPPRPRRARPAPALAARIGSGGETPPRLVRNAPPVYPPEAVVNRWEGTVLLRLHVTAQGQVGVVEIVQSSGHPVLDGTAAFAVKSWLFEPATRRGQPIASSVRLPVRFAL